MAVRADVYVMLSGEAANRLYGSMDKFSEKMQNGIEPTLKCAADMNQRWMWVKKDFCWNNAIPDIKFIEDFLNKLPPEFYCFILIGGECKKPEVRGKLDEGSDFLKRLLKSYKR